MIIWSKYLVRVSSNSKKVECRLIPVSDDEILYGDPDICRRSISQHFYPPTVISNYELADPEIW